MFVPLGNIIMLYVLAFSQWKVVPAQTMQYPGYPPVQPPLKLASCDEFGSETFRSCGLFTTDLGIGYGDSFGIRGD